MKKYYFLIVLVIVLPLCGFGCTKLKNHEETTTTPTTSAQLQTEESVSSTEFNMVGKTVYSTPTIGKIVMVTTSVIGDGCSTDLPVHSEDICKLCKYKERADDSCIISRFYFTDTRGKTTKVFESGSDVNFKNANEKHKVSFTYGWAYEGAASYVTKYLNLLSQKSLTVDSSNNLYLMQRNETTSTEYLIRFLLDERCTDTTTAHYEDTVIINDIEIEIKPIKYYCYNIYGDNMDPDLEFVDVKPDDSYDGVSFSVVNSKQEKRNYYFDLKQGKLSEVVAE